jgi:(p)ppGpp synthase/HD superfamily hydrolase
VSSLDSVVATGSRRFSRQALTRPRWVAGSPLLIRAYALAADAYRGRRRASDESPLLAHAIEVAELLRAAGRDQSLVAAALLHDAVEHGTLDQRKLEHEIGEPVTGMVAALAHDATTSSPAAREKALRKQVDAAGDRAVTLLAADTLSNVRALRRGLEGDHDALEERLGTTVEDAIGHYRDSVAMIEQFEPDSDFLGRLRSELAGLPVSVPATA